MEDDHLRVKSGICDFEFQSTSPVWRTTNTAASGSGEIPISIHVPRVEDDNSELDMVSPDSDFNPRPPCGGRRLFYALCFLSFPISIHVPRVEDDTPKHRLLRLRFYFNPRPPCGGRRCRGLTQRAQEAFQSTSPVWRTTAGIMTHGIPAAFQSTSPVWRTTGSICDISLLAMNFNPRPPCGGRQGQFAIFRYWQ